MTLKELLEATPWQDIAITLKSALKEIAHQILYVAKEL